MLVKKFPSQSHNSFEVYTPRLTITRPTLQSNRRAYELDKDLHMSISQDISELKDLFAQNTSLIDRKLASLDSIASRVDHCQANGGGQSFDVIRYQLNDLLGKLENRLVELQGRRRREDAPGLTNGMFSGSDDKFRNKTRSEAGSRMGRKSSTGNLGLDHSTRSSMAGFGEHNYNEKNSKELNRFSTNNFDRSFNDTSHTINTDRSTRQYKLSGIEELVEDLFERERNETLNDAYDSLTSIQRGNGGSPNDAIAQLRVYFNSIINIVRPGLKEDFGRVLKSAGDLTETIPYNERNVQGLNDLVHLVENMIGAFTE